LERRLHGAEEWEYRPKPKDGAKSPAESKDPRQFVERSRMLFDVIKLALETDSLRHGSIQTRRIVPHSKMLSRSVASS
jgi:hypothetical protein